MTSSVWLRSLGSLAATLSLAASCGGPNRSDAAGSDSGGGNGSDATGTDSGGGSDAAGTDSAVSGIIPDPGTVVGGEWTDVEPNDVPWNATPVGILDGAVWAGFVPPYTQIDSPTDVDWYVFRTSDAGTLINDYIQFCWGGGVNLLDLYLYEVVAQMLGPLVRSAETANTSCETIIPVGEGPTILLADTTYLLEVRAAPGLSGAGLPGMYGA